MPNIMSVGATPSKFKIFNMPFGVKGTNTQTFDISNSFVKSIIVAGAIGHSGAAAVSNYSIKIYGVSYSGDSVLVSTVSGQRNTYQERKNVENVSTVRKTYSKIKVEAYSSDNQSSNNNIEIIVCL